VNATDKLPPLIIAIGAGWLVRDLVARYVLGAIQ
jgi:hypothetical protein